MMKAGLLQFRPEFGKPKANAKRAEEMLSNLDFDLCVLPELSNSGYLFSSMEQVAEFSENISDGNFVATLKRLSREKNAYIVAGICEKSSGKFYNTSVLIYPDGKVYAYRKLHLFDTEKKWFTPGSEAPEVYHITGEFGTATIGMMICFDWFFPETARMLALKGAQIICHPSNLVLSYCQRAMFARAVENRVFTITSNRTGTEKAGEMELTFTGQSVMVSPKGEFLISMNESEEDCVAMEIDQALASDKKVTDGNDLFLDRRTEIYKL